MNAKYWAVLPNPFDVLHYSLGGFAMTANSVARTRINEQMKNEAAVV
jgi:hypothetical protein